ncbi:MAG: ABC transporter permease subunit [Parvibaculum sp.]|jgi:putrescine transport system permease protein|uniref:ABC transporter permease subunit n=1 Tax=Parvibaculum sp. TaxID=2024848 RepID=UPI00285006AA|nr:ABC transporter permease subunit [Parvibaculum sp.]MDR3499730.1 ABC transporter permease subunit [Parvibaculum sp.]
MKVTGLSPLVLAAMILGFVFLYAPIVMLVIFSFNASRLVTVWAGFSTQWYATLLTDDQVLGAAYLSFKIAFMNATLSVILGTLAAVALVRFGRFWGRSILIQSVSSRLVLPDVILGLSILLLFVSMQSLIGWPTQRGFMTILIAHVTFSSAYVAIVVQSRLAGLDRSFEEAAFDLGASPFAVFRTVTLPLIAPALVAGWLLAFILSFDDLVIASFASGPSATTLPMVIFSKVRFGITPEINALATIIVVAVAIGVVFAGNLLQRQNAQRLKEAGRG